MAEKLRTVLVTDRGQTDVNRGKYLLSLFDSSGIWRGTEAERIELEENHGFYTFVDVNRVLRACAWLAEKLEKYAYSVPFSYYKACLISVEAKPRSGGIVTGALGYTGENVEVKATAANDFQFLWWEEDGNVVSKSSVYRFPAERDRDLTAVFLAPGEADNGIIGIGRIGQARIWRKEVKHGVHTDSMGRWRSDHSRADEPH